MAVSSGFVQGQLVNVYGLDAVAPGPAEIPATMGRGAGPATLPSQAAGMPQGASNGGPSIANTGLPVWLWVVVFGVLAYVVLWKVFS